MVRGTVGTHTFDLVLCASCTAAPATTQGQTAQATSQGVLSYKQVYGGKRGAVESELRWCGVNSKRGTDGDFGGAATCRGSARVPARFKINAAGANKLSINSAGAITCRLGLCLLSRGAGLHG